MNKELFKTEDGFNAYEGDEVWAISDDAGVFRYRADNHPPKLTYHTREKAEEHILMNKPCLSVNDVISVTFSETVHIKRLQEELTNLAKSKI